MNAKNEAVLYTKYCGVQLVWYNQTNMIYRTTECFLLAFMCAFARDKLNSTKLNI
jgi:hypothetical protein